MGDDMTHSDLIGYYGNGAQAARALGVTRQAVNNWRKSGVPLGVQYQAELATQGALRADEPPTRENIERRHNVRETVRHS